MTENRKSYPNSIPAYRYRIYRHKAEHSESLRRHLLVKALCGKRRWTGAVVELVELIYALHEMKRTYDGRVSWTNRPDSSAKYSVSDLMRKAFTTPMRTSSDASARAAPVSSTRSSNVWTCVCNATMKENWNGDANQLRMGFPIRNFYIFRRLFAVSEKFTTFS